MRPLVPLVPFAVAALLLGSGCGTERPAAEPTVARAAHATASPAPSPSAAPSSSAASTSDAAPTPGAAPTQAAGTGQLSRFPLTLGYPDTNEDDGSPVRVTSRPATRAYEECHRTVWDPREGSLDVIGVEFRGEAEWYLGRTLVLYPTIEAATAAVDRVAEVITSCPRDDGDDLGWAEHTGITYETGDQSFGYIDRWWSSEVDGYDTGLTTYHVVRVGRSVLLSYDYGEGNGSERSRLAALAEAERNDQPVIDTMRWL